MQFFGRPFLFVCGSVFLGVACWASEPSARHDWLTKYYVEKDVTKAAALLDGALAGNGFEGPVETREQIIGFLGAALRGHPDILCSRIRTLYDFEGIERDSISLILWWSDMDCSRRLLRSAGLTEPADTKVPSIKGRGIHGTDDPSFLMGWFYATGDTDALAPMINHLIVANWDEADDKTVACGSVLGVLCEKDERARFAVEAALERTDISDDARKVFLFALGRIKAEAKE